MEFFDLLVRWDREEGEVNRERDMHFRLEYVAAAWAMGGADSTQPKE